MLSFAIDLILERVDRVTRFTEIPLFGESSKSEFWVEVKGWIAILLVVILFFVSVFLSMRNEMIPVVFLSFFFCEGVGRIVHRAMKWRLASMGQ